MRLEFREPVHCADAEFGELADIIIDPQAGRVTHLVVEPHHRHDEARLVPLDGVKATATGDGITLDYTLDALRALERVQKIEQVEPGKVRQEDDTSDVGIEDVLIPNAYEGFGLAGSDMGVPAIAYDPTITLSYDRIPRGMVEIRRASPVFAAAGDRLGHVGAVVVGDGGKVSHLVLEHRHLLTKRDVAIPLTAVARLQTDRVTLNLSADEVAELR